MDDCLIIGGGPAGLTAAIYLARYRRTTRVVDDGHSRTRLIPTSRNVPGFPDGRHGTTLLQRLRDQLQPYGVPIMNGRVDHLAIERDYFVADVANLQILAKTIILCTGVIDSGLENANWEAGIRAATLRLCPVCDAYEVTDRRVALVARSDHAVNHALFLRRYTPNLTLFHANRCGSLLEEDYAKLQSANIELIETPDVSIAVEQSGSASVRVDGHVRTFDAIYPLVGCYPRTELGLDLGVRRSETGEILTDPYQETGVPGLFSAGDVVNGLNQISVAVGQASIAATRVNQYLGLFEA